jgi:tetratricopeptide (TPR) repeat protein
MFGYALALFAWLRGEDRPEWARQLRPDVRGPFRKALAYLTKTGDSTLTRHGPLRPEWQGPYPADPTADPRPRAAAEAEPAAAASPEDYREPSTQDEEEFVPASADDFFSRAVAHLHEGDPEAALLDLDEAVRLDPDDAEFYQERSSVLAGLGRHREALADALEAVRLAPDEPDSYRVRGVALFGVGDYAGAIEDFTTVIDAGGRDAHDENNAAEARYWRALAWAAEDELELALKDLTRAINTAPTWPNLYRARAGVYDQLEMPEKAQRDRAKAASLEPLQREEPTSPRRPG